MKKIVSRFTILAALLMSAFWGSYSVEAQMTVGTNKQPESFSILELNTTEVKGGLRLPLLDTDSRDKLALDKLTDTNQKSNARGLAIYNTDTKCFEFWNSEEWVSICSGNQLGLVNFSSCDLIEVVGIYDLDKSLSDQTVRIDIPVNVRKMGEYRYSAICNGVTFTASGTFVNMGPTTVSLYVDSSGGNPTSNTSRVYDATVTITPVESSPDPTTVVCNGISVNFIKRSGATMKILNIAGVENGTGLTSSGGNYTASSVYATIGEWLEGESTTIDGRLLPAPITYSGTASIRVVDVAYNSMAQLQNALADASIVWVGAAESYTYGFAQLLREWSRSGKGIIIITGDKVAESTVSDALGYYIEDGSTATGTFYGARLPQVFSSTNGSPFNLGNGALIGYSGSNCGYVSSNNGVTLMTVTANNYPSAFADIDNGVFIFGDKFGTVAAGTTWDNFAKVLADVFAWSLRNAPIY